MIGSCELLVSARESLSTSFWYSCRLSFDWYLDCTQKSLLMTFAFYICTGEPSLVPRLLAAHREPGYEVKENHSAIILYEPLIFVALLARGRWVWPRSHISTHLFASWISLNVTRSQSSFWVGSGLWGRRPTWSILRVSRRLIVINVPGSLIPALVIFVFNSVYLTSLTRPGSHMHNLHAAVVV